MANVLPDVTTYAAMIKSPKFPATPLGGDGSARPTSGQIWPRLG